MPGVGTVEHLQIAGRFAIHLNLLRILEGDLRCTEQLRDPTGVNRRIDQADSDCLRPFRQGKALPGLRRGHGAQSIAMRHPQTQDAVLKALPAETGDAAPGETLPTAAGIRFRRCEDERVPAHEIRRVLQAEIHIRDVTRMVEVRIDAAFGCRGQPPAAIEAAFAADGVFDEIIDAVRIEVGVCDRLGRNRADSRGGGQRVGLSIASGGRCGGLDDLRVVKTGTAKGEGIRGGHPKADLHGAGQARQGHGIDQRPCAAIRGGIGRDRVATADEAHPVVRRGVHRRTASVTRGAVRHRPPDHAEAVVLHRWRGEDRGVTRSRGERLADHDAGFRPGIGVRLAGDACADFAIAGELRVGEVEAVRGEVDVRAGALQRVGVRGAVVAHAASDLHGADILRLQGDDHWRRVSDRNGVRGQTAHGSGILRRIRRKADRDRA